jgi:hypothetical protein
MTANENIPWKRLSVEAAAIVGSILLAFAIDAWWEDRLERNDETEQISRLRAEFLTNIERIDERSLFSRTVDDSIDIFNLIDAAHDRGETTVEVPATSFGWMLLSPTFEADMPVLDGLIRSGRLEIVQDRRILAALAVWERELRDYTVLAERARRIKDTQLLPALYVRGDIGAILVRVDLVRNNTVSDQSDFVTIRIDEELKGVVAGRYRSAYSAQKSFGRLRSAGENVIAAIDAAFSN